MMLVRNAVFFDGETDMGSDRKSKKKRSPTESSSEDEGKNKRRRSSETKSDKKDRDSDRKHKSRKSSSKEGKPEEKHKHKHKHKHKDKRKHHKHEHRVISNFKELSEADYFSKNNEFATWLKDERDMFFSDLSSESAHKLFAEFIKDWNKQKLDSKYYDGIVTGPRTSHNWKIKVDTKG